ncbi:hypothetical protein BDZ85DRAFT_286473 [Elsinoe ampelina]|uniref:Uncharacterized protein n=1 Tax=Elsinoe ampelina TaxID=302913 RepID=A0A6A6FXR4_9PEZI|nr:hypothetical protein BDZ85DRAFT_286473 [Elsinoe ampelina]
MIAKSRGFPHRYHDGEGLFGTNTSLYEFPAQKYPYERQTRGGHAIGPDGKRVPKGYARAITDRDKNIRGVIYHPEDDRHGFRRADEVSRVLPHTKDGRYVTSYQSQQMISGRDANPKVRNVGTRKVEYGLS